MGDGVSRWFLALDVALQKVGVSRWGVGWGLSRTAAARR